MKSREIIKKIISLAVAALSVFLPHSIDARHHRKKNSHHTHNSHRRGSSIGWGLGGFALGAGLEALFSSKKGYQEPEKIYYEEYEPHDRYENVIYEEPIRRTRFIEKARPVQVMRPLRRYRPSVSFGLTVPITNHSYFSYSSNPFF